MKKEVNYAALLGRRFRCACFLLLLGLTMPAVAAAWTHPEFKATPPTLGVYPNAGLIAGGNTTITPDAAPVGATELTVAANTNFTGVLTADPATGVVTVINAKPAGTYTVTVTAFGSGGSTTATFTLTVTDPTSCQALFSGTTSVSALSGAHSIGVGDFNGDGNQDLATANFNTSLVTIRLGNGMGGFSGSTSVTVGSWAIALAIGDFNGDGHQDFAAANANSDNVSIRLGDGAGGFSGSTNVPVGDFPTAIAIGDFNGDGKQDFAATNRYDNTVSIRLGDGLGGFSGSTNIAVGAQPRGVTIGDFNGDGKQDFVTANNGTNTVSICLGDGLGGFGSATSLTVGNNPYAVAIGDFNEDGFQDLAVANGNSNTVSIRLGDGLGGFTGSTNFSVGNQPWLVAVGDFNGDGNQDWAVANALSNTVSIFLGDGLGNFSLSANLPMGTMPRWISVGDFNNDGKQDLVASNFITSGTLMVRLGVNNEINVQGNGMDIDDGDNTPSAADHTDFDGAFSRNFTLQNTDDAVLTISGITSDNAKFAVSGAPATVAANSSAAFTVTYNPTGSGVETATITVNNNDCDEAVYDFAVTASCDPPAFSACPAGPINVDMAPGECAAVVVNYIATATGSPEPVVTYSFTGATTGSGSGTGSGTAFNKGNTTVTVTATNGCASPATCVFTVTVADSEAPVLTCPAAISQNNDAGQCTANVIVPVPDFTDNCATNQALHLDGVNDYVNFGDVAIYDGRTTLTMEAWVKLPAPRTMAILAKSFNAANSTRSFDFRVAGGNLQLYFTRDGGGGNDGSATTTGAAVTADTWHHVAVAFNLVTESFAFYVDGVLQSYTTHEDGAGFPNSGGIFNSSSPLGIGRFSWNGAYSYDRGAIDEIRVWNSVLPQATIQANMATEMTGNESGLIAYYNFNQGIACGANSSNTTLTDLSPSAKHGTLVNFDLSGAEPLACESNWTSGAPLQLVFLSNDFNNLDNASGTYPVGSTVITWTATDASGNTATCQHTVTVADIEVPTLTNPGNQNLNTAPGLCTADYTIADPVSDNCTGATWGYTLSGATTGSATGIADGTGSGVLNFNKGVTTVELSATDGTNNAATVSFTVTVTDNQAPTLTNPGNQNLNTAPGLCTADYTIADPVSDNCTGATWGYTLSGATTGSATGIADGTGSGVLNFNKGVTTVELSATDGTNNATTVSFTVTVTDNQAPTLTNPGNQNLNTASGLCTADYTIADPVSDNCTGATWGYTLTGATTGSATGIADGTGSGALSFNRGVTTVVLSATDGTNSATTVSFTVTVTDNQLPTIACPAGSPFSRNTDAGECNYTVSGTEFDPTAYGDNCPGAIISNSFNNSATLAGAELPQGPTTITWTVTDGMGMSSTTCAIVVTVLDNQMPTISCPANISQNNDAGQCTANVTVPVPDFTDNCATNQALFFDGVNDYVDMGDVTTYDGLKTVTFEAWLYVDNVDVGERFGIIGKNTTALRNWLLYTSADRVGFYAAENGGSNDVTLGSNPVLTAGTWHHVAISLDLRFSGSEVIQVYVDGVLIPFTVDIDGSGWPNSGFVNNTAPLRLGYFDYGSIQYGHGRLDEIRVWNFVRSQAAIQATMSQELTGNETGLIAYYNFNEGVTCGANPGETTLPDLSPSAINGTLTNFALTGAGSNPCESNWTCGAPLPLVSLSNDFNNACNASGIYPVGSTVITWTGRDAAGNTATCQQTVTVADIEVPTLTNPGNQNLNTAPGLCTADYTIADPVSDNCSSVTWGYTLSGATTGSATGIADGTGSGTLSFNQGVTTVVLSATDGTNSATTVSFTVTVTDNQAPTLTNPGNQNLNTASGLCTADYTIADPVSDNCTGATWGYTLSGATTGTVTGLADGTGSGVLSFNQGVTTVELSATDGTNSATTVSFTVTVTDNQAPTLINPGNQNLNTASGLCTADYTIADPVSDNCTGATWGYTLSGATTGTVTGLADGTGSGALSFNQGVTTVELSATDGTNSATTVLFTVTVTDNQAPTLINPGNQNLNTASGLCTADYIIADPVSDNCTGATWGYTISGATTGTVTGLADGTGSGTLSFNRGVTTVVLSATDGTNSATTVSFTVTVTDNQAPTLTNPGNQNLNTAPGLCTADYTIADPVSDNCTGATWGYTLTGATTGAVTGIADGTGSGVLSFNQGVTTVELSATDGTNSATTVSFTVTVTDNEPPVISGCPASPQVVNTNNNGSCELDVPTASALGITAADNCVSPLTINQSATTHTGTADGGTFTVDYTVTDGNGNTSTCTVTIQVNDDDAPAVVCPTPAATYTADAGECNSTLSFVAVSVDNCGIASTMYSVSGNPIAFPYDFPVGSTTVAVLATDIAGNTDACSFEVNVSDCYTITGQLIWKGNGVDGLNNSNALLNGSASDADNTGVGGNGMYTLIANNPGAYTVSAAKNAGPAPAYAGLLNGVMVNDAQAIQAHIVSTAPINDWYRLVAADVNKSQTVTTVDAAIIQQAILNNPFALSIMNNTKSWRFIPTTHTFGPPANPAPGTFTIPAFPQSYTGLTGNNGDINFYGVKTGDVVTEGTGNADPSSMNRPGVDPEPLVWVVRDRVLRTGKPIQMDFTVQNFTDIASYQFGLDFDPSLLRFDGIEVLTQDLQLDPNGNFGLFNVDNGEIRTVWVQSEGITLNGNPPVFRVQFTVLQGGYRLSDAVHLLDASVMQHLAFDTEFVPRELQLAYIHPIAIGLRDQEEDALEVSAVELLQNRPNPFSDQTIIGFVLPEACDAQLRILSVDGREVVRMDNSYPAGYNQEVIRTDQLGGSGVYYYELTTPFGTVAKKMIVAGR